MEYAGHPGLLAGLDGYAGTGDGSRGGYTAKEGQQNVAHALSDQLLVRMEVLVLHAGGGSSAQQALDHTQCSDGDDGGHESGQHIHAQPRQMQAVRLQQGAGNIANHSQLVQMEHRSSNGGRNDTHQRAGHLGAPFLRPYQHDDHHQQADGEHHPEHC